MNQTIATRPPCVLRLPTVMHRTGLSRSTIYQRVREGSFPRQIVLGPRFVGWSESDISAWIQERTVAIATMN
jgi:prophage regulatory protein